MSVFVKWAFGGIMALSLFVSELPAQTATDLNEGARLEYDSTNEIYRYKWWGKAGRTYFIQHSEDLANWTWVPVIELGDDSIKEWGFTSNATKFFVRLRYTDIVTADPEGDDFDNDGISNLEEVQNDENPFTRPAAADGLQVLSLTDGRVLLSWNDNSTNETGFVIERSDDGGETWSTLSIEASNATHYLVEAALAGSSASLFRITAQNGAGSASSGASGSVTGELDPYANDDTDPLLNGEEIELGTNPLNEDTDGDDVTDDLDGWATVAEIAPKRWPVAHYAVIPLPNSWDLHTNLVNNKGQCAYLNNGVYLWTPGEEPTLISAPGSGTMEVLDLNNAGQLLFTKDGDYYVADGLTAPVKLSSSVPKTDSGYESRAAYPELDAGLIYSELPTDLGTPPPWPGPDDGPYYSLGYFSRYKVEPYTVAVALNESGQVVGSESVQAKVDWSEMVAVHDSGNGTNAWVALQFGNLARVDEEGGLFWSMTDPPAHLGPWTKFAFVAPETTSNTETVLRLKPLDLSNTGQTLAKVEKMEVNQKVDELYQIVNGRFFTEGVPHAFIHDATTAGKLHVYGYTPAINATQTLLWFEGVTAPHSLDGIYQAWNGRMQALYNETGSGGRGWGLWQNYKFYPLNDLVPEDYTVSRVRGLSENGIMVGQAVQNGVEKGVLLLPAEVMVDKNRDGQMSETNAAIHGKDQTSDADGKRFVFWVNDDRDVAASGDENDEDSTTKDYTNDEIDNKRDLEDFTRLWIYIGGLQDAISQGNIQVGLKWKNVTGTPAIKLYESVEAEGGTNYLTDETVAGNQILLKQAITFGNGQTKITGTGTFVFPSEGLNNLFAGLSAESPKKYFIFEGAGRGKGQLVLVFLKDGQEIGEGPGVWLDLKDIKELYENWTIGDGNVEPSATASRVSSFATASAVNSFSYPAPQKDEEKDYVLLVHGWNMYAKEKERWAETMFKRLWQQNYKGRVGVFRWPTLTDDTISWGTLNPFDDADGILGLTYDPSEFTAWKSGAGLLSCLNQLNGAGYSGRVRMIAHSMGNVVATEALRKAGGAQKVNTYVAAQAAMPAHCYDSTRPSLSSSSVPPFPTTPNVYAHYWESGQSDQFPEDWSGTLRSYAHPDYMTGAAGKYVNFYNEQDYALRPPHWEFNQRTKPDNDYNYSTALGFHYDPFNPFNARGLKFPADRYEVFAFCAEGQSRALGRQSGVGGVFANNQVNLNGSPYSFGSEHKYHSGEFRSNVVTRWSFWEQFLIQTGLKAAE